MVDIAAWLNRLGLQQYEQAFRDNDIDAEVLPELTAEDLIGLGVTQSATAASYSPPSPLWATNLAMTVLRRLYQAPQMPLPVRCHRVPNAAN